MCPRYLLRLPWENQMNETEVVMPAMQRAYDTRAHNPPAAKVLMGNESQEGFRAALPPAARRYPGRNQATAIHPRGRGMA
jgi:hypothetical protein